MATLKKQYPILENDFMRAGEATIQIKTLLKTLNLDSGLIRRIAICSYEGEMNVVMHGNSGRLCIEITQKLIRLTISDCGPGIQDIELAMTEGYSTATEAHRKLGFGAGIGLPNMKKNAGQFHITSRKGKGTSIVMTFSTELQG
jgi:serine/threonine-protein kinase RsbT